MGCIVGISPCGRDDGVSLWDDVFSLWNEGVLLSGLRKYWRYGIAQNEKKHVISTRYEEKSH